MVAAKDQTRLGWQSAVADQSLQHGLERFDLRFAEFGKDFLLLRLRDRPKVFGLLDTGRRQTYAVVIVVSIFLG